MLKTSKNILALIVVGFIFTVSVINLAGSVSNTAQLFTDKNYNISNFIKELKTSYNNPFSTDNETTIPLSKWTYLSINSVMARFMGQRYVNHVIKLNNGLLCIDSNLDTSITKEDVDNAVKHIEKLNDTVKNTIGGVFLEIVCPSEVDKYDLENIPAGYTDKLNPLGDYFVENLDIKSIDYIDIREELHIAGINYYDAFYKTDHHWPHLIAFWGYSLITERLLQQLDVPVNIPQLDLNNYDITEYPNAFLGSNGKRVGYGYVAADGITVVSPKWATDIENVSKNIRGDFEKIIIDRERVASKPSQVSFAAGNIYGNKWKTRPYTHFINHTNNAVEKKLLLIGDSWENPVAPFFAVTFKELAVIYSNNASDVKKAAIDKIIEEFNPDAVIDLRYLGNINRVIYK